MSTQTNPDKCPKHSDVTETKDKRADQMAMDELKVGKHDGKSPQD